MCLKAEKQKLEEDVTYYAGLPTNFKEEGTMYVVDILTDSDVQRTNQYSS